MAHIQFVHNPQSGSFSPERYQALLDAASAIGNTVVSSVSSPTHPFALETGVDHVCAVGGDGTVRHVAAHLAGVEVPPGLSIYPMGTINLVAREIGWPQDASAFVRQIAPTLGTERLWPVRINEDCFIACASIGPDARAVAGVSTAVKARIGRLAYGLALIKAFAAWHRPALQVVADGNAFECEAIYIAKGRYFAGPWSFATEARLDQQTLHIVALQRATRTAYARFLTALVFGRVDRMAGLHRVTARTLSITCATPQPIQIDGDIGSMTPVDICIADRPLYG